MAILSGGAVSAVWWYTRQYANDQPIFDKPDVLVLECTTEEPKPPAPQLIPTAAKPVATVQYVVPQIVRDELMPPEEEMPDMASLEKTTVGLMTQAGEEDNNSVPPPVALNEGTGLAVAPVPTEDFDPSKTFVKVENPAEFPGGIDAWRRYLERNLRYPEEAVNNEVEANVIVEFIVDPEGNISEVKALNDPGYGLATEAVRIIAQGPRWIPAEQSNRKVRYRHRQPIIFRLNN
jgi:protein TonB